MNTTDHQDTPEQPQAVTDFLNQISNFEIERKAVLSVGVPSLKRLSIIAKRDTGQAATVRLFLLGLYNGHRFPFDLTRLRGLDSDLFTACIDVLTMDARATVQEIHLYFDNGSELFEAWAKEVSK
ncbi:DUF7673 family protein [Methylomonas rapida]|uniref:DUF7673 domain-containing protein n=1 Tax=Methylomonas rapida TaxID=2963939 RepID=A0ABY7GG78_9GAMM|nr:hypothetical protein [Methylomonas rapida]WAR42985.1 hypothetical protein NM686_011275 [Methylomonas rapida]WAR42998.1 hypothetical protein NM686_011340 [Methylomonas rapida]